MAYPSTEVSAQIGAACDVLPTPPERQLTSGDGEARNSFREMVQTYTERAREALDGARASALRAYDRARDGAARNYVIAANKTQDFAVRTRDQARRVQREHPVQVLAVVAGTAFLAGIATRIWRSR